MILPSKHLREDRALLGLGADVLKLLREPKTVSRLWDELQEARRREPTGSSITFDWFILSLDLLHGLGAVELDGGLLRRSRR